MPLNYKELLKKCRDVDALGEQCAVGDLDADVVVLHGQTVLASFDIRVEDQGGAILEAKTGETAYARSDLFEKRRALMESWSAYIAA